jgi:hypothetical protein
MAHNQPHQAYQDGPTSNFNDSIKGLAHDYCPNIVIGTKMAWNSPWLAKKQVQSWWCSCGQYGI